MRIPSGTLDLRKIAAPATPPAGRAVLYFKSDGVLYFKDESGVERSATGGGTAPAGTKVSNLVAASTLTGTDLVPTVQGGISKKATLDQIKAYAGGAGGSDPWTYTSITSTNWSNSTTTASDIFGGFAPAANTTYLVEALIIGYAAATATGLQLALAGPTSGINTGVVKIESPLTAATALESYVGLNVFSAPVTSLAAPGALYELFSIVRTGTPGAGNIRVQGRSEVSGSAVTASVGSFMRYRIL